MDDSATPLIEEPRRSPARHSRLRVWHLMATVALLAVAFAGIRRLRIDLERPGLQGACYSSLNNIALAMYSYSLVYGQFPRPFVLDIRGRRTHSWRMVVLPLINSGYTQIERYDWAEPWNGRHNSTLSDDVPGFLQCPSRNRVNKSGSPFVMINDFGNTPVSRLPRNAILVIEAWDANQNWLDPCDKVVTAPRMVIDPTDHPAGFGVILCDFTVLRTRDTSRIRKKGDYYVLDP